MPHAVELSGVAKTFGSKVAVDRLDLTVPEGAIFGFIGPNGSGKTTTIRLILRIYKPDAGRVAVLGRDEGEVADDRVGYLPEERGLYKRMKVAALLEYFARLKGHTNCRPDIYEWLDRLGAGTWANQRIDTLSKGMAQKVQFIAAVIARPKLVILDEPFSGLDPVNMEVLKEAVVSLRAAGTTVIFSTHDMSIAEMMCDTIFMIFNGRKVLDGSLSQIQSEHPLGRVRLRIVEGARLPELPGVEVVEASAGFHELALVNGLRPQALLQQLAGRVELEHFEVMRPTLHDIFVKIARPSQAS